MLCVKEQFLNKFSTFLARQPQFVGFPGAGPAAGSSLMSAAAAQCPAATLVSMPAFVDHTGQLQHGNGNVGQAAAIAAAVAAQQQAAALLPPEALGAGFLLSNAAQNSLLQARNLQAALQFPALFNIPISSQPPPHHPAASAMAAQQSAAAAKQFQMIVQQQQQQVHS